MIVTFQPTAGDQVMHHRLLVGPTAALGDAERHAAARGHLRGAAFFQQQHGVSQIAAKQQAIGIRIALPARGLVHHFHTVDIIGQQPYPARMRLIQRLPDRLLKGVDQ